MIPGRFELSLKIDFLFSHPIVWEQIELKMSKRNVKNITQYFGRLPPQNWTSGDVKHTNRFVSTKSIILDSFQTTKSLKTIIFEGFTEMFYHFVLFFFSTNVEKHLGSNFLYVKKNTLIPNLISDFAKIVYFMSCWWFSIFVIFVKFDFWANSIPSWDALC